MAKKVKTKLKHVTNSRRKRKIQVPVRKIKRRKGSEKQIRATPPCKLTLYARRIVFAAVEAGLPLSRCKELIGVSGSAWSNYMKYGEDERYPKFYNFCQKLKRIEKNRELEALKVIRESAKGGFVAKQTKITSSPSGTTVTTVESTLSPQWQAAAWFLERKDKLNWAREGAGDSAKSVNDIVQEIQEAQLAISNSVPTNPEDDSEEED